jgi:hypothetical protein
MTNEKIENYLEDLKKELIKKNTIYGDSLQNPIQIFQKDKVNGILGRIDDKLNRIKTVGINKDTEDTIKDLIGYLVHLEIMIQDI